MACPNCSTDACQLPWEPVPIHDDDCGMATSTEPFLVRQWKSVPASSPWGSIEGLSRLAGNAVAGCCVDGTDAFMQVQNALEGIREGRCVSIKGWEYVAQGCADAVRFNAVDNCLLANNKSPLARKVSEVMRWVFVGTVGTGSACHIDPLATVACTWLTHGRKEWRMASGVPADVDHLPSLFECSEKLRAYRHLYKFTMEPGDLIFIPRGCLHEPAAMWDEVRRALSLVMAYGGLTPLENHPKVDSLLFGMLMACMYDDIEMPEDIAAKVGKIRPSIDFAGDEEDI
ncbi:hypothetical protein FOZ60_013383 [Perkinsus olseni]|uniref:JmjC domain-containing protein n=1 Tax=Perkinsus olseni TaxID=32597 RepID=A0A7J6PLZ4_PEROL|nr:hypothetical protein FOZ60_013383 [Perkinsus olseni]